MEEGANDPKKVYPTYEGWRVSLSSRSWVDDDGQSSGKKGPYAGQVTVKGRNPVVQRREIVQRYGRALGPQRELS